MTGIAVILLLISCDWASRPSPSSAETRPTGRCERLLELSNAPCDCSLVGGDRVRISVEDPEWIEAAPDARNFHAMGASCLIGKRADGQSYLFVATVSSHAEMERVVTDQRLCLAPWNPPTVSVDSTGKCIIMEHGWFLACNDPNCN